MCRLQERGSAATLTTRRRAGIVVATALVIAADQATKTWAVRALDDGPIDLVWTLRFRLVFNDGAAFGLGGGNAGFFVVAGVILVLVLVGMARAVRGPLAVVALGLVLGGAIGNLLDRLLRDTDGAVVDFVDLQWWPVFNLADAAIVVGAFLLVVAGRERQRAEVTGRVAGGR